MTTHLSSLHSFLMKVSPSSSRMALTRLAPGFDASTLAPSLSRAKLCWDCVGMTSKTASAMDFTSVKSVSIDCPMIGGRRVGEEELHCCCCTIPSSAVDGDRVFKDAQSFSKGSGDVVLFAYAALLKSVR